MFGGMPDLPVGISSRPALSRFDGGLDVETPAWEAAPGSVRDARNYEIAIEGGYQDIQGYERFDGRPAPSDASFMVLDVTVTGSIVVGDTVTGLTTGDTGLVIAVDTYPDTPSQTYLVLTKVVGDFDNATEDLQVSAITEGNVDAIGYVDSGPTPERTAIYKNLAADEYRADIAVVPGQGSVWGGFTLNGTKYAIRDKSGGVTSAIYVESASGWTEVDLGLEIAFTSGGTTEITEGATITGLVGGATATVERIQVTSGTWGAGDAAGWLILSGQTGTFQSEGLSITGGGGADVATIGGDSSAITLEPGGRLDYDISNFADTTGAERAYGADTVNLGWEFDGTVFFPIRTGMAVDTPDHVIVHKNHLFFAFNGSVQHSGTGDPTSWSVVLGAGEIATGHDVTGFQIEPGVEGGASLLIACRQQLFMLYGNDSSDWNLIRYREKVGAYRWTIQQVAYTIFLDDRGITDFRTAQEFGNFDHSTMSDRIRRLIVSKRSTAVASCVSRDKNQYRIFFSDKTGVYVTMRQNGVRGMMPVEFSHQITTMWSEENASGDEEMFFGADDGYVYQLDKGTSFDGGNISAWLLTHFDNAGMIEVEKGYFGPVTIEGQGTGYAAFDLTYELDYARSEVPQPNAQTTELNLSAGGQWDVGLIWDTFEVWDTASIVPSVGVELEGEGRNISWYITKDSDYFSPVLLSGIHYRFMPRVQRRL